MKQLTKCIALPHSFKFVVTFGLPLLILGCGGGGGGGVNYGSIPSSSYFAAQTWSGSIGSSTSYQLVVHGFPDVTPKFQTVAGPFVSPDFCPSKNAYVFVGYDPVSGALNLYTLSSAQSAPVLLTQTGHNHHNPRFSPDGNTVVFSEDTSSGSQIFTVPYATTVSQETPITAVGVQNEFPSVSPDNHNVVFVSSTATVGASNSNFQIYTVPIKGGAVTRITFDGNNYTSPSYGGDSAHFLCAVGAPLTASSVLPGGQYIALVSQITGTVSAMLTPPTPGSPFVPATDTNPNAIAPVPAVFDAHPRFINNYSVVIFDRTKLVDHVSESVTSTLVDTYGPTTTQIFSVNPISMTVSPFSAGGSIFSEAIASDPGNEPN